MSRKNSWIVQRVLQFLFPMKCPVCGVVIRTGEAVCTPCLKQAELLGEDRKYRVKLQGIPVEIICKAPCLYKGASRETLHRLKFSGKTAYAHSFGLLMAQAAKTLPGVYDTIAFVPMTEKKQRQRGYNQAQLLAQELGKALSLPVLPILTKTREIQPQHTVRGKARKNNVKNVFSALPLAAGKSIILVDDILTTGATLTECTKALYLGGAVSVAGITAACSEYR